jgi:hypothetical protein
MLWLGAISVQKSWEKPGIRIPGESCDSPGFNRWARMGIVEIVPSNGGDVLASLSVCSRVAGFDTDCVCGWCHLWLEPACWPLYAMFYV